MANLYSLTDKQFEALPAEIREHLEAIGIDSVERLNEIGPSDLEELLKADELKQLAVADAEQPPVTEPAEKAGLFGGKKKDKSKRADKEPEPKADFAPEAKTSVRIVARNGDLALVEWQVDRDLFRAFVPHVELAQSALDSSRHEISTTALEKADLYGEDWASHFDKVRRASPDDIARSLRASGIWTYEELMARVPQAQVAYNTAHAQDFAQFVKTVRAAHTPQEE